MDTKRLVTMMLLSFAIIFGWQLIVSKMYEAHPEWKRPGQTSTTAPTTPPSDTTATQPTSQATTAGALTPSTGEATSTQSGGAPSLRNAALRVVSAATQPATITLGENADDEKYPMRVKLSSAGAGLDSVTLKKHKAPDRKSEYVFQQPYDASKPETRPLATRSITVNGAELPLAGVQWNLDAHDDRSATFSLDLGLVRVRKTYQLTDGKSPSQGYELNVRHEIENRTTQPIKVQVAMTGPTTPPRESERGPDLQVLSGYDNGYGKVTIAHHMVDEYSSKSPMRDLTRGPDNAPLLWTGTASVYFDAILRPQPLEGTGVVPKYVAKVQADALNPEAEAHERHVAITLATGELAVDPGKSVSFAADAFMGPRWRKVLNQPYYGDFPRDYDETLVLTSGPCAYCTFSWLINGLVMLLGIFHWIFGGFAGRGDWGLAIIALVVLVRSILHPITKRSQVSMMRMGKLGPEVERLKKKYENDKDELNRQMMQLYKDQGIGAYLGCLPMFLQMPIWIALWSALQSTFELRHAPFLWRLTWIKDLARPDHFLSWDPVNFTLPLMGNVQISGLNLLPLLMAVVMYLQQKYTPQPPSTTPEQEMQKKMMLWMSVLMFPLFLYNGPSGLNLYILTSTTIGIIESKRIRDHIKQKEEEEKAGKVIVDAPKGMKKRRDDDDDFGSGAKRSSGPKEPKGGIAGWLQQLQSKAEELRGAADRGRK